MRGQAWRILLAAVLLAGGQTSLVLTQPQGATSQPANRDEVPADLRPLLARPASELRLVTLRYTADRALLSGNYDGGGRAGGRAGRGGGRGGRGAGTATTATTPPPVPRPSMSTARIARLKRFDHSWQAALAKLDAATLTAAGRAELDQVNATIAKSLTQLDADAATIATLTPAVPFAAALVDLNEARIRLVDVDSAKAAATLTAVVKEIAALTTSLKSAESDGQSQAAGIRLSREAATRGADAVDGLRASMTTWFNFYNGYDPMFTWWMGMPHGHLDAALKDYASFLRDTVAPAAQPAAAAVPPLAIEPAPAPKHAEVPDLAQLIALPQDEMTPVVQRFVGEGAGGGRAATNSPGAGRPREFYQRWLTALGTLDFDALSRNAQVDYLFIKKAAERHIARLDFTPEANPPRKSDSSGIAGAARGRTGLMFDLADEMIPYSPEQLIALANRELAWCEDEMKKASRALGFGDDWKQAIEQVKNSYVAPGRQPAMIRDLLFDAIEYLRAKDLVTVSQVAAESLHMSMMTPEAQLVNPFFLGGSQITVSYPTNTMEYDARMQSMRGNNPFFSTATAHHEMIPGHNLVGYVSTRSAGYRARIGGNTPFFGEGWPLYWELTLYDLGFFDSPEKKIGALFWRMHRGARIIFSLNFHMGDWSPQEAIDFLVDRVGHERDNATAEVRRSFQGDYGPLYQAAYLLGGLQLRGLRKELVDSGQLTNAAFHDEILRQGSMPIALIRLALTKQKLTRGMPIDWQFYGDLPDK